MSKEPQTVFQAVFRVIHCVKNGPLRGRLFAKLCDDMEAEHTVFLYHCETCWLSHVKLLHRVFELKEGTDTFLSDSNYNNDANLLYNEYFIQKLDYFVDSSEKLSNLKKSMQGLQINTPAKNDKVNSFVKSLELSKRNENITV